VRGRLAQIWNDGNVNIVVTCRTGNAVCSEDKSCRVTTPYSVSNPAIKASIHQEDTLNLCPRVSSGGWTR
jgi:hypothetical protein